MAYITLGPPRLPNPLLFILGQGSEAPAQRRLSFLEMTFSLDVLVRHALHLPADEELVSFGVIGVL